jgi:hypothetical protein
MTNLIRSPIEDLIMSSMVNTVITGIDWYFVWNPLWICDDKQYYGNPWSKNDYNSTVSPATAIRFEKAQQCDDYIGQYIGGPGDPYGKGRALFHVRIRPPGLEVTDPAAVSIIYDYRSKPDGHYDKYEIFAGFLRNNAENGRVMYGVEYAAPTADVTDPINAWLLSDKLKWA